MPLELPPLQKLWLPPKPAIIRAWKHEALKLGFLPGFIPPGAAAAGRVTTLTQVGSGTTTAANGVITSSVTIKRGDLIAIAGWSNGGAGSASFPPGFTSAVTIDNTATLKSGTFYKIATGSEGTSVTGFSATGIGAFSANAMYVFRADNPIRSVTVGSPAGQTTGGNPSPQVVTSATGTPPLVVSGGYMGSGSSAISPRTFTVGGVGAKDGEVQAITGGAETWHAYKIYNASPANVTVDAEDDATTMMLASCYFACA